MMHADPPRLVLPVDGTPIVEAAEIYLVRLGLPPIPVYGTREDGSCLCRKGAECQKPGKHPVGNGWQQRASLDLEVVRKRFRDHVGNIGIYTGQTAHVCIDADGELGAETIATWGLPPTLSAISGSGRGSHHVLVCAPHHDPLRITDRRVAPGVDVKIRGQFVVAPSRHATGGVYRWTQTYEPALLPDRIYELLVKPDKAPAEPLSSTKLVSVPSRVEPSDAATLERRARAYADKCAPAISGSGGHDQTFALARAIAGFVAEGLPEHVALTLLAEYNARCQPPWTAGEIAHKWRDAKGASKPLKIENRAAPVRHLHVVGPSHGGGGGGAPPQPDDWRQHLLYKWDRHGKQTLRGESSAGIDNIKRILQLDPRWKGRLAFDEFGQRVICSTDMPWDEFSKPTTTLDYWTDEDATRLATWLARDWAPGFQPEVGQVEKAVDVVSKGHAFHPVRDYLNSISWDGTARLSTWLHKYLDAPQSEYSRVVGIWWLVSAVARIYDPGCKVDHVPILEGKQGKRKSTAVSVLAGKWFSDAEIDLNSKDAAQLIQGCWLVELAELDSLMKTEPSESKRFFSRAVDHVRLPWGRRPVFLPRQCVFVGTTNLKDYLTDPTGARRFYPIPCGDIDIEALRRDRDQLWAEACHEYREGRKWYPETAEDRALVGVLQDARTQTDALEETISDYIARNRLNEVRITDILEKALELKPKDQTRPIQVRVGTIMHRLGWSKRQVRDGELRRYVYERRE